MWGLSKRSEYGIFFLLALAEAKEPKIKSINTISKELDLPYRFLSQIAGEFRKAHIVNSKEGVHGGYFLTKKPQDITLSTIISTLDNSVGIVNCLRSKACRRSKSCSIKSTLTQVNQKVTHTLNSYSIQDFLDNNCLD